MIQLFSYSFWFCCLFQAEELLQSHIETAVLQGCGFGCDGRKNWATG
jgi:hypothetical protein